MAGPRATHATSPGDVTGKVPQPVWASQVSLVHTSPSSQTCGAYWQPVAGLQLSSVQALASSQEMGTVLQSPVPGSQLSVVHASPSSQWGAYWQPVLGCSCRRCRVAVVAGVRRVLTAGDGVAAVGRCRRSRRRRKRARPGTPVHAAVVGAGAAVVAVLVHVARRQQVQAPAVQGPASRGLGVVHQVEAPRPVRGQPVEGAQHDWPDGAGAGAGKASWELGVRGRERAGDESSGAGERRRGVAEGQIHGHGRLGPPRIGQEDRVLSSRGHEQSIQILGHRMAEPKEPHRSHGGVPDQPGDDDRGRDRGSRRWVGRDRPRSPRSRHCRSGRSGRRACSPSADRSRPGCRGRRRRRRGSVLAARCPRRRLSVGAGVGVVADVGRVLAAGDRVAAVVGADVAVVAGVRAPYWQPVTGSQLSSVQTFPSSQEWGACWQPVTGSQLSSVQTLPSSQEMGTVLQSPVPDRRCRSVQTLPSSQCGAVLAAGDRVAAVVGAEVVVVAGVRRVLAASRRDRSCRPCRRCRRRRMRRVLTAGDRIAAVVRADVPVVAGDAAALLQAPMPASQLSSVQAFPSSQEAPCADSR